jgi:hypothetical protein
MLDYSQRNVMANYGGALGRNFGNSGVQEVVGDAMGRATAGVYDSERQRQMASMGMSPGLSQTDYRDISSVLTAGDARQGMQQQMMGFPMNAWGAAATYPQYQLGLMSQGLGAGSVGGTQSSPNPYQSNPAANAIGMGVAGYGAASAGMLGGTATTGMMANPWLGAALGVGAGLLASRF